MFKLGPSIAVVIATVSLASGDILADAMAPAPDAVRAAIDRLSPSAIKDLRRDPREVQEFLERQGLFQEIERRSAQVGLLDTRSIQRRMVAARRQILADTLEQRYVTAHAPNAAAVSALAADLYAAGQPNFQLPRKIKVAQISLYTNHCEPEETVARLQEMVDRVKQGEKFADLAREYSEAPNAEQGGLISQWVVDVANMRGSEFLGPALALETAGDMTEPFVYGDAHHVLMVVVDHPARPVPFDDVKDAIEQRVRSIHGRLLQRQFHRELEAAAKPPMTAAELRALLDERAEKDAGAKLEAEQP